MTINGIQSSDPFASSTSIPAEAQSGAGLGKDAFMKLLVNQIKNQDPLSPSDNTQYLSQLAQFSSLEKLTSIETSIKELSAAFAKLAGTGTTTPPTTT